jgi:hypothetical protein
LDVSISGGTVPDKQGRTAVASLVTAGSVLLGTALLAAGCASSGPTTQSPVSQSTASHSLKDGDLAAARADLRAAIVTERRFDRRLIALSFPPRTEPFVACSTASTRPGPR